MQEEIEPLDLRFSADEIEPAVDRTTSFIREQVDEMGVDGAVVGLSGGVDSTTIAHLAVEALGVEAVHGLILPREVNEDENMTDAERVASDLGITYDVIGIESVAEQVLDLQPEDDPENGGDQKWERRYVGNTSARVRMTVTYLIANRENKLVLGTGNRAELSLGYVTKYGDGGVDCNPIGDLYKQQVRQFAAHLGVGEEIVQKTPTGGMIDYGTDEEELGVGYDTVDAILALHIDGDAPPSATARIADASLESVEHIDEMYENSAHKRRTPPTPDSVE